MAKNAPNFYYKDVIIDRDKINDCKKRDSSSCMVTEAVNEQMPLIRVITDSATIRGTHRNSGARYIWLTPPRVQEYIADWDEGRDILPFKFKLSKPVQIVPVKPKITKPKPSNPLDVTKASSKEIKDAIRQGKPTIGQTVVHRSPNKSGSGQPIIIGGETPPIRTVFGPMRRYGYRGLARRYEDVEARAREQGRAEAQAEFAAQNKPVKRRVKRS